MDLKESTSWNTANFYSFISNEAKLVKSTPVLILNLQTVH